MELLFSKYHGIEHIALRKVIPENKPSYEKSAEIKKLKLAFGDAFCEKIENYLWTVQVELDVFDFKSFKEKNTINKNTDHDKDNAMQRNFSEETRNTLCTLEIRFPEGMIKFINYTHLIIA